MEKNRKTFPRIPDEPSKPRNFCRLRYYTVNCILVNIPEPVQYVIYALTVPFDLRCESGTY